MNLILLRADDYIAPAHVRLIDQRAQHIREILGANTAESVKVGNLNGLIGSGVITHIDAGSVELQVSLTREPPAKLPLTIILALPRPKMMRRIFRTIAEMGVSELILLNTYKVEKSYWSSPAIAAESVDHYFQEGLQQARDTVMPTLRIARLFKPFAEDELPALIAGRQGLVAHPGDYPPCPINIQKPCTLAIGPEGGFTEYEIQKLETAGLQTVQLGERILRVETAITGLIARLYC